MKTYKLYQVDSFTKQKFTGNPAGVVSNADGLSENQMLQIAREMNNSETAFIFKSDSPDYDVEVRFFTPTTEVPICGHATVAAHYVYAGENNIKNGRLVQKTKAGILPVDIEDDNGDKTVTMTQGEISISDPFDDETTSDIMKALGITDVDRDKRCPVCIASTGYGKVMVAINSDDLLHGLKPDMNQLIEISRKINCNGYYVFTLNLDREHLAHGRMFAPISGLNEDPVTGNANGPLGAYLVHNNLYQNENEDKFIFKIKQGEAMGRPGTMTVTVHKNENKPVLVQITGDAVVAFSTEITI